MALFPLNKIVGMEVELRDNNQRVVGKVVDCKIESLPFHGPAEYTIKFYANDVEVFVGGKKKEIALDLSGTVPNNALTAEKVVFNYPATVVLWADGTKTVVRCDKDDEFDEMKGLALCYMKKALGNTSRELNRALRRR